jgi:hypothetical protein
MATPEAALRQPKQNIANLRGKRKGCKSGNIEKMAGSLSCTALFIAHCSAWVTALIQA